jgi:hypothetical protein
MFLTTNELPLRKRHKLGNVLTADQILRQMFEARDLQHVLTFDLPTSVLRQLSKMLYVNSDNNIMWNLKWSTTSAPPSLTAHVVALVTFIPVDIVNIVASYLDNPDNGPDCTGCAYPIHLAFKGPSVNCGYQKACLYCTGAMVSEKLSRTCEVCTGMVCHRQCNLNVASVTCTTCTPREKIHRCQNCRHVWALTKSKSTCITCDGYVCNTCQNDSKCRRCSVIVCGTCQEQCLTCEDGGAGGYCITCWQNCVFDCSACGDASSCFYCTVMSSCSMCINGKFCQLCSDVRNCENCNRRVCPECEDQCCDNDADFL